MLIDGYHPTGGQRHEKSCAGMTVITESALRIHSHGHCGMVDGEHVLNDASVDCWSQACWHTCGPVPTWWHLRT